MVCGHHVSPKPSCDGPWPDNGRDVAPTCNPTRHPLSSCAVRWLASLPEGLAIDCTRAECPELLDRLASHWEDPLELTRVFNEILFATEVPRARLKPSFEVLLEITSLRQYAAAELHRWGVSVWDDALYAQ